MLIKLLKIFIVVIISLPLKFSSPRTNYLWEDYLIDNESLPLIKEKKYALLCFLSHCLSCEMVLEIIVKRSLFKNHNLYYLDMDKNDSNITFFKIRIEVVPTLILVKNNSIIKFITGSDNILFYLSTKSET